MKYETMFEPRDTVPPLGDDEIHLWFFSTPAGLPARAVAAAARTALESLLIAYAPDGSVPRIAHGPRGKPYAQQWPELEFNLSHAGPHVALAFARGQALGVDLERLDRQLSLDGIARRFFAPSEVQALLALEGERKRGAFFRLWTHKEAVLKALGEGLSFGLDRLAFSFDDEHRIARLRDAAPEVGDVAEWRLVSFEPAPQVVGAVAWRGAPRVLRTFGWVP